MLVTLNLNFRQTRSNIFQLAGTIMRRTDVHELICRYAGYIWLIYIGFETNICSMDRWLKCYAWWHVLSMEFVMLYPDFALSLLPNLHLIMTRVRNALQNHLLLWTHFWRSQMSLTNVSKWCSFLASLQALATPNAKLPFNEQLKDFSFFLNFSLHKSPNNFSMVFAACRTSNLLRLLYFVL